MNVALEAKSIPNGLRWASDSSPGIRRRARGKGFAYTDAAGRPVSLASRERIRRLAIPPAWTDVWISPDASGHIQATGRDARGRKQYVYHADWRTGRDADKFERLLEFGRALPAIRKAVDRDLRQHHLSRPRVIAAAVRLLDEAAIRVGNDQYARANGTFGLTTLRSRHASVNGSHVVLKFKGKGGKLHEVDLLDRRLARVVGACGELPGQELFQFENGTGTGRVHSEDINQYLRESGRGDFTAKHFRTWTASAMAAELLAQEPVPESRAGAKRAVNEAARAVALVLGNTMTVTKASYIHPRVFEAFETGALQEAWAKNASRWESASRPAAEMALLHVLRRKAPGRPTTRR